MPRLSRGRPMALPLLMLVPLLLGAITVRAADVTTLPFERLTLGGLSPRARDSPPIGFLASRWPASASETLSPEEFGLGRLTSGAHVDFETNATSLTISWTLKFCLANDSIADGGQQLPLGACCFTRSPSQTATGGSGVDLFAIDNTASSTGAEAPLWRHVVASSIWFQGTGFGPDSRTPTRGKFSSTVQGMSPATRRFRLHLPLHNALGHGSISVSAGATLSPIKPPTQPPIVWIGGATTMGAYVSRAGWAFPSVVSRWLDRDVLNYGLQGRAAGIPMSLSVAKQIASDMSGQSVSAIVIDCTGEMTAAQIANRTAPLVELLRKAFPDTPVVLAETPPQGSEWLLQNSTLPANAALRAQHAALLRTHPSWRSSLHYVEGWRLYHSTGEDFRDADEITGVKRPLFGSHLEVGGMEIDDFSR
jgi:hypothetical protein